VAGKTLPAVKTDDKLRAETARRALMAIEEDC
jgi:hypothetical protein